jgi:hypothetical protein
MTTTIIQPPQRPVPDPQADPDQPVPIVTAGLLIIGILFGIYMVWKRRQFRG